MQTQTISATLLRQVSDVNANDLKSPVRTTKATQISNSPLIYTKQTDFYSFVTKFQSEVGRLNAKRHVSRQVHHGKWNQSVSSLSRMRPGSGWQIKGESFWDRAIWILPAGPGASISCSLVGLGRRWACSGDAFSGSMSHRQDPLAESLPSFSTASPPTAANTGSTYTDSTRTPHRDVDNELLGNAYIHLSIFCE